MTRSSRGVQITKMAEEYKKQIEKMEQDKIDGKFLMDKKAIHILKAHKQISRAIKTGKAQPLAALERKDDVPGKGHKGTITTDESEIEEMARKEWQNIYDGNVEDTGKVVDKFMIKYDKYTVKGKEIKVGKVKWESLKEACRTNKEAAGGMDKRKWNWGYSVT